MKTDKSSNNPTMQEIMLAGLIKLGIIGKEPLKVFLTVKTEDNRLKKI